MSGISDIFGSMVFSDVVMQERLPADIYRSLQKAARFGERLTPDVAAVVASTMKHWAIEKGATHFTHWFQPLTGAAAEKHDCFISPAENGRVIMEFSGKELIRGESDASSFPSGGLRATFEARGYTAWDPTSYAFVRDNGLYIPTAFCSYGGEALDMKTPLLRSMETLNKETIRLLRLFGNDQVTAVNATAGPEQEYFLVDRQLFDKRKDLIYTGRTIFGAPAPRSQDMSAHYYGVIKPRVANFMADLDNQLWKLGILAKTEHNEAAPAQHELAPIFDTVNIAADHNQLTMDVLRTTAEKHGMVCLLHEKPFKDINGSGKHNNWSLLTDTGENLLDPGATPAKNAQFLAFLCAVIKGIDEYQDILRFSVASPSNDFRLGGNEAPPAILSVYLGEQLTRIIEAIVHRADHCEEKEVLFKIGVHSMPRLAKDSTDRNRTSPIAFTGNKFEFRTLGSSASISLVNTVLNTIIAEEIRQFADTLEKADNFDNALHELIRDVIKNHKRIIFNGNGYDEAWAEEAQKRGLLNLKTTPDCIPSLLTEKNIELFARHKVFSRIELESRSEIAYENYCNYMQIEARTALYMLKREILPAVSKYCSGLASNAAAIKNISSDIDCSYETDILAKLKAAHQSAYNLSVELANMFAKADSMANTVDRAFFYKENVISHIDSIRTHVDFMEANIAQESWPYPNYGELLFSLR
ncbi:MAG: glutamine synthetase III [Oscillospiraceae bacterium]|nr:glutamine synthetase III [Oscillospiraceae bacterium]